MSRGPFTPLDHTTWRRLSAGVYENASATQRIQRVRLDDGDWWIVVDQRDGSYSDPIETYRAAKASVAAEFEWCGS